MSELNEQQSLACPFCGGHDISEGEVLTTWGVSGTATQSMCNTCGALGPEAKLPEGKVDYGDVRATEAWNRRATPAPQAAPSDTRQPIIGRLMDAISGLPVLWGLNEPGALLRNSDVFNVLVKVGKEYAAPAVTQAATSEPALTATHGPLHLTNRKTAQIAATDYNIVGYVLRRTDGDAVCISAESAVRWLPQAHYWRLMHEQDGSLFAAPVAHLSGTTPNTEAPSVTEDMVRAAVSAVDRFPCPVNGSVVRGMGEDQMRSALSAALSAQQAGGQEAPRNEAAGRMLDAEAVRAIRRAVRYLEENDCTGPAVDLKALLATPSAAAALSAPSEAPSEDAKGCYSIYEGAARHEHYPTWHVKAPDGSIVCQSFQDMNQAAAQQLCDALNAALASQGVKGGE